MELMIRLLEAMIKLYFDRNKYEPDKYQMWSPSQELKRYHRELQGLSPRAVAEINQKMSDAIVHSMRKRFRE